MALTPQEIEADFARKKALRLAGQEKAVASPTAHQNGASSAPEPPGERTVDEPLPEERGAVGEVPVVTRPRREMLREPEVVTPPHSREIEFAFLGAMFQHPVYGVPYALTNATQDSFFVPWHKLFFDLATHYFIDHGDLEFFAFQDYLIAGGYLDAMGGRLVLTELGSGNFPASAMKTYLATLREKHSRREALRIQSELARRAADESEEVTDVIAAARQQLESVASLSVPRKSSLTIRTLAELTAMTFDETDNYFGDRVIAAGQACTLLGPGGIGKSRFSMQLAVCMITGRSFLDIATHAPGKKWLFIQTENNNRRLHHDLKNLVAALKLTPAEVAAVDRNLIIHTLENDADSFLNLVNPQSYTAVESLIRDVTPSFIEWDPLNSFTDEDLNSDMDMRAVVTAISRITRIGDPHRVPFVLHHSLTGKVGASRAVGWEKASYGRNSKVLQAWTRAQINLAPRSPDDPNLLIMSCGKNNNGKAFPEIGIEFHEELGIYFKDDSFDAEEFREEVGISKSGQFKARYTKEMMLDELSLIHGTRPPALKRLMDERHGMSKSHFYRFARELHDKNLIVEKNGEWFKAGKK